MLSFPRVDKLTEYKTGVAGSHFIPNWGKANSMNKAKAMNKANKRKAGLRDGEISTEKNNL